MQSLVSPICGWSAAHRRRALLVCLLVSLAIAIPGGIWLRGIYDQADTTYYLNIAAGKPAILPFASRQLGPLLVRALVFLSGVSIRAGFTIEGLVSIVLLILTVISLLLRSGAPRFMLTAIAGMFFWAQQFNALVMPDLFYAALLCGLLLLLRRQRFLWAGLMMFPLVIARESTLLTLVCFLIAGWRILRWREVAAAVLSLAAGVAVVRHLTAHSLPNTENISPMLYLVAKIPWNLLKNFFGVDLWANVYTFCGVPRHSVALHLGPLTRIGVCGWQWRYPLFLLGAALTSFGLLPLLVYRSRAAIAGFARSRRPQDMLVRFCIVYGIISFALAGMLGESFARLFDYSWPLFLVGLPILLAASGDTFTTTSTAAGFLAAHLVVSWCGRNPNLLWVFPLCIALNLAGWALLRRFWRPLGRPVQAPA